MDALWVARLEAPHSTSRIINLDWIADTPADVRTWLPIFSPKT